MKIQNLFLILLAATLFAACGQKNAEENSAEGVENGEGEMMADAGCTLSKEIVFEVETEKDGVPVKQVGYYIADFKKGSEMCKQELENMVKAVAYEEGVAQEARFFTCPIHGKSAKGVLENNAGALDEEHTNYCAATYTVSSDGATSFTYAPGGEENLHTVHQGDSHSGH